MTKENSGAVTDLIDSVEKIRPFMETWLNFHPKNDGYGVDSGEERGGEFRRANAMEILDALDALDPNKLNVRDHAAPCGACGSTARAMSKVVSRDNWEQLRGQHVCCFECGNAGPLAQTRHDAVVAWNEAQEVITPKDHPHD